MTQYFYYSLISLICLILVGFTSFTNGLSAHIRPNERLCLYERVKGGSKFTVTYQVGYGGDQNIIFWVTDPSGTTLHTIANEHTGSFSYVAPKDGSYSYCFTNHASVKFVNPVQFAFINDDNPISDPKALIDPVQKAVDELSKMIHAVKGEQRYFVYREKAHFSTANSSNVRILWWSVLQVFVLVGVCLFQVFYLKHFFETKRRI